MRMTRHVGVDCEDMSGGVEAGEGCGVAGRAGQRNVKCLGEAVDIDEYQR